MSVRTKISTKSQKAVREVRANYQVTAKRALTPRQNLILKKCKQALKKYYGERLKKVILYGSMARGQTNPASDIDLLVLLSPPCDYFAELRQVVEILYPIQLNSER